jgi:hypothetical protein
MVLLEQDEVDKIIGKGGTYLVIGTDEFGDEHEIIFTHGIERIDFGDEDLNGVERTVRQRPRDTDGNYTDGEEGIELPQIQSKGFVDGEKTERVIWFGSMFWSFKNDEYFYNSATREFLREASRRLNDVSELVGTKWHSRCYEDDRGYKAWEWTYLGKVDSLPSDEQTPKSKKGSKKSDAKKTEWDDIIKEKINEAMEGNLLEDDIETDSKAIWIMIKPHIGKISDNQSTQIKERIKKLLSDN